MLNLLIDNGGIMDTQKIIEELNSALKEIEKLKEEKKCIASPLVKSWKKKVEDAMEAAGSSCAKNLQSFRALKFGAPSKAIPLGKKLEDFVQYPNYLIELEAAEKIIKSSIQTLKIFGKPEKEAFIDWTKKEIPVAEGQIKINNKIINLNSINLLEIFSCFEKMIANNKAITEDIKIQISKTIDKWRQNPLLSSLFSTPIDKLLGYLEE